MAMLVLTLPVGAVVCSLLEPTNMPKIDMNPVFFFVYFLSFSDRSSDLSTLLLTSDKLLLAKLVVTLFFLSC